MKMSPTEHHKRIAGSRVTSPWRHNQKLICLMFTQIFPVASKIFGNLRHLLQIRHTVTVPFLPHLC